MREHRDNLQTGCIQVTNLRSIKGKQSREGRGEREPSNAEQKEGKERIVAANEQTLLDVQRLQEQHFRQLYNTGMPGIGGKLVQGVEREQ